MPALRTEESLPQMVTRFVRKIRWVRCTLGRADVLVHRLANFFFLDMNGWQHNVAWRLFTQLNQPLAQIGIDDFQSTRDQIRVQMTLLSEHRLALNNSLHPVRLQDVVDDLIVLFGIGGPVDHGPPALLHCAQTAPSTQASWRAYES